MKKDMATNPLKALCRPVLCLVLLAAGLSGCESLYDAEGACDPVYKARFIYDMNMSGGDGFPSQVRSVSLWAFHHADGSFAGLFSDAGDALAADGYRLDLSGLQPGDYDFIAWCGLDGERSFSVPPAVATAADLTCDLQTTVQDGVPVSRSLLSPLFYGSLTQETLPDAAGEHTLTVRLMKNTNNINISLQQTGGEALDPADFTICMTGANGSLASDNIPSGEITYYPWSVRSGTTDLAEEKVHFIQAEISTGRLMADRHPVITITDNAAGRTVYAIPIVEWAKKLRSLQHLAMDDQEYLDREHEYTVMLHLVNEAGGWKAVSIVINGYEIE